MKDSYLIDGPLLATRSMGRSLHKIIPKDFRLKISDKATKELDESIPPYIVVRMQETCTLAYYRYNSRFFSLESLRSLIVGSCFATCVVKAKCIALNLIVTSGRTSVKSRKRPTLNLI